MTMSLLLEYFDNLLITPENAEQLNNVILQLAMQGKLVLQDSKDEPASELLKNISKEYQVNLSPVNDDEKPYEIPNSWEWVKLEEIAEILMGQSPPGTSYNDSGEGVPLINGPVEFGDGPFAKTKKTKFTTLPTKMCREGDLLVCVRGSTTGRTNISGFEACIGRGVAAIRSKFGYQEYLNYFMLYYRDSFYKLGTGSTFPSVSSDKIQTILFPLPPLAEQQRIVARVEELFAQTRALAKELAHSQSELDGLNKSALSHLLASETHEEFNQHWDFIAEHFDLLFQAPEHVAPLRQSILELAVRGKLTRREAGDESAGELMKRIKAEKEKLGRVEFPIQVKESEKPFSLPDNWEWIRLEHLLPEYQNGLGRRVSANTGKERIILRLADLGSGIITTENSRSFILPEEEIAKYDLREGDILITRVNGSIDLIGSFTLVTESDLYSYCDHFIRMRLLIDNVLPVYLALVSKSNFVRKQIQEKFITTAGQKTVNQRHISSLYFPLPPLAEQERIVKRVEQLLSLCDALEGRLQSAEEERGRLVAAVMSTVNS